MPISKTIALGLICALFCISGVAHFLITEKFVGIMPPYIPFHYEAVYVSGVFELLGALGLLWQRTRKFSGYGLVLLTICVTPANVYMWQNADLFPTFSSMVLSVRLVVQVFLIWYIWWAVQETQVKVIHRCKT